MAEEGAALLALIDLCQTHDLRLLVDKEAGVLGDEDERQVAATLGRALGVSGEQAVDGRLGMLEDAVRGLAPGRAAGGGEGAMGELGERRRNGLQGAHLARVSELGPRELPFGPRPRVGCREGGKETANSRASVT